MVVVATFPAAAHPSTTARGALSRVEGQDGPASDVKTSIDRLSAFDYPTRMNAARLLRRASAADVVPALMQAARSHPDQFVRYRALVLLTAFRDPATGDVMRALLADRNDRVRAVAYRWFEDHPDVRLLPTLLSALNTEQAEFVRPALIRALAALGSDTQVQRALVVEAGRGLDFFRSAVIDALGEHRATYAGSTLAAVARTRGPLQDDAVLALGKIGDRRALAALTNVPIEAIPAHHAALCLVEDGCGMRIEILANMARGPAATPSSVRVAVAALGAIAARGHDGATTALFGLANTATGGFRDEIAVAFSSVAVRRPDHLIAWLDRASEDGRVAAIDLLRSGFEALEEDYAEEQFFAAVRAAYWAAAEASETRTLASVLIDRLEF